MATVRVHATTSSGRFGAGPLSLTAAWSAVDAGRADVRAALVAHVGLHCKVHPLDVPKLTELGLVMADGRLVETRPAKVTTAAPPATTAEVVMPPTTPGTTDRRGSRAART